MRSVGKKSTLLIPELIVTFVSGVFASLFFLGTNSCIYLPGGFLFLADKPSPKYAGWNKMKSSKGDLFVLFKSRDFLQNVMEKNIWPKSSVPSCHVIKN